MRISDWSSDVCSSDLTRDGLFDPALIAQKVSIAFVVVIPITLRNELDLVGGSCPSGSEWRHAGRESTASDGRHFDEGASVYPFGDRDRKSTRLNSSH